MKAIKTQDQLLKSFADFQIAKDKLNAKTGGGSSGSSHDADGCSNVWIDVPTGYCHTEDYTTEG